MNMYFSFQNVLGLAWCTKITTTEIKIKKIQIIKIQIIIIIKLQKN